MYRQAKDYLSKGAVDQAITILKQALQLDPQIPVLRRDLAYAQNIAGKPEEAWQTVSPLIDEGLADEQVYQIAGSALTKARDHKKARSILLSGLAKYPNSGVLNHEYGLYLEAANEKEQAYASWLKGATREPGYHLNYYQLARMSAETDDHVWTLIYGELFVNMERYTARSQEMRRRMLDTYPKLFQKIATLAPAELKSLSQGRNFESAVLYTFSQLSPVVSDGFTTENLTMLRTRFIMAWTRLFQLKYPFTLYSYHDKMLRYGYFDAYNQWLFGKVENEQAFDGWNKFHPKAIADFENWAKTNKLILSAADFYQTPPESQQPSGKKKGGKR